MYDFMDTLNSSQKMRNSISTPFSIRINDYHLKEKPSDDNH